MKKCLKKQTGVTLIALIVTIAIVSILAGVTVNVIKNSMAESKRLIFISELEMIQQKMMVINKEIELGSNAYENIGIKFNDLDSSTKAEVQRILTDNGVTNYSDYVYMSKSDLLQIGLKNIEQDVIICYGEITVYSFDGVSLNNQYYYSLNQI